MQYYSNNRTLILKVNFMIYCTDKKKSTENEKRKEKRSTLNKGKYCFKLLKLEIVSC